MVAELTQTETQAYKTLIKLCPELPNLKQGEYALLKTSYKNSPEVLIGCKHRETENYNAIYEIQITQSHKKDIALTEISHRDKTACPMLLETIKNGEKTTTPTGDIAEDKLYKMLKDLERKGYKSTAHSTMVGHIRS